MSDGADVVFPIQGRKIEVTIGGSKQDPLSEAIYLGMKRGINHVFDAGIYGSAVTLIYTAIDTMAWLDRPDEKENVTRKDFINWVAANFDSSFTNLVTAEELYSARCSVVHSYTVESRMTRSGTRVIGYKVGGDPPVNYNPSISSSLMLLDIGYLKESFFDAIDRYLMKAFSDPNKGRVLDDRAQKLLQFFPYE